MYLIPRQKLAVIAVQAQRCGHILGYRFPVSREHNALFHTGLFQLCNPTCRILLHHIGNDDMTCIRPVNGNVNNRSCLVAILIGSANAAHQLAVTHGNSLAVDHRKNSVTADLLDFPNAVKIHLFAVSSLQALGYWVRACAFCQRRVGKKCILVHGVMVYACHLKYALGEGACFVKDHIFGLGKGLQIVGALYENALSACAADACKKAEGHADHQRAGAADHQEGQRSVDPISPHSTLSQRCQNQRRQDCKCQCADAHRRGVDTGEAGDELLGFGLPAAGIFHQLQNFGNGGFSKDLGGANGENAPHIHAAADDCIPYRHLTGQALAGEGTGVQAGRALYHHPVQRDLLSGADYDLTAHRHGVGGYLYQLSRLLHIGIVGANIHKGVDVFSAFSHRIALKPLADLVEQHNRNGFVIVAGFCVNCQRDGAHRGNGHKKILIKHSAVDNAPACLSENVVSNDQIAGQKQSCSKHACCGNNV